VQRHALPDNHVAELWMHKIDEPGHQPYRRVDPHERRSLPPRKGDAVPERQFLATLPSAAARLLRVAHDLSFARDLETVVVTARRAARELSGADGVSIVLRSSNECYYADEEAIAPLWKGRRFPLETCVSGWVMTQDLPVVIADIYADPRVPHEVYRPTFVKSLAIVPVRAPEPIAAIGAYWAHPHEATEEELGAMTLLADNIALALRNVELYNELSVALRREKEARRVAEAAIASKDEFLALVAHELRQPLHASLAALRMMSAGTTIESGEHGRSVVERQLTQMTRLVEELLDAARIVRGHVQLNETVFDMRTAIERAADSLRALIAERQHEFVVSLPAQAVTVQADAARLEQVFANLLSNAAKYTDPGGRVTLSLAVDENFANITVTDTGRGIDPAAITTIFNLFARAASASDVRGFGVGLAATRRLVELHGGTIQARSDGVGRGAQFRVSLPLAVGV
jgi:signal transduction histidine kinase